MPILTPSDQAIYFPDVEASGTLLESLLRRAQYFAESIHGAKRSLERSEHTQEVTLRQQSGQLIGQLAYWPIELDDPAPIVQVRPGQRLSYGGVLPSAAGWVDFTGATINARTGELTFACLAAYGMSEIYGAFTHARVTYTAGWDFSISDSEVVEMKHAAAELLRFLAGPSGMPLPHLGIKSAQSAGEYAVTFSGDNAPGQVPAHLLATFKRYAPKC